MLSQHPLHWIKSPYMLSISSRKEGGSPAHAGDNTGGADAALFRVRILGTPTPQGRPRFNFRTKSAYYPEKTKIALRLAKTAVARAHEGPVVAGALRVEIVFVFARPVSHFGPDGMVRASFVGATHTVKPDLDNLVKLVLDSMNNIVYTDDKQVTEIAARKVYSNSRDNQYTRVSVFRDSTVEHTAGGASAGALDAVKRVVVANAGGGGKRGRTSTPTPPSSDDTDQMVPPFREVRLSVVVATPNPPPHHPDAHTRAPLPARAYSHTVSSRTLAR
jgi:Holliday junction resolvase RusA-like endonuclease